MAERNSSGQFINGPDKIKLDINKIADKYNEGLNLKQVGELFGVSDKTILRRLKEHNIPRRKQYFQKGNVPHPNSIKTRFKKGHKSPCFKTGERYCSGYREVWDFDKQKYVKEHRKIMEESLGRKLSREEHIHHINEDKLDNRIENLRLMTNSEHHRLHGKEDYKNKKGAIYKINNF